MSWKEEAASEKKKLKNMSLGDKLWYIWEYYKLHMLGIVLAIAAIWIIAGSLYRQTFDTRLSIAIINDKSSGFSTTESFEADLKSYLDFGPKDLLELDTGLTADFDAPAMSEYDYASLAKISALVASKSLDVMVSDEKTIRHYAEQGAFSDLTELLPTDLLAKVEDHLIEMPVAQEEGQTPTPAPVALSIEGTRMFDGTGISVDSPTVAIMGNSLRKEDAVALISYLFE